MDLGVRDRAYIVVGGSRGMGWETVRLLAENGGNVAVISRNPDGVRTACAALAADHGVAIVPLAADVTRSGSVEDAIGRAVARFGRIRGLAVTNFSRSHSGPFHEIGDAEWDYFHQDVLMGTVRGIRAIVPHMIAETGGQIVVTSAYSVRAPKPFLSAYASYKAALVNLTKNLAKAYGGQGIRVNAVCPGFIDTERSQARTAKLIAEHGVDGAEAERMLLRDVKMQVALDRLGKPAELGEMIAFLLSERAAYTTGLIANVDGGTDF